MIAFRINGAKGLRQRAASAVEVEVLGQTDPQRELLDARQFCGHLIRSGSFYSNLARLGDQLFCDSDFADMYDPARGRHSVPPSLLAKVQLLQSFEGLSDREAADSVRCDLRWKTALGLSLDDEGFDFSLLCYFRQRLRTSAAPRRILERFKEVADEAGMLTKSGIRVLDSTPILSAVQTQDTVTMIRGALRTVLRLLAGARPETRKEIQAALRRQDYEDRGKPVIDWDDEEARIGLVDELVNDALVALAMLENSAGNLELHAAIDQLATVAGQDVEWDQDKGRFRIRRGVAKGAPPGSGYFHGGYPGTSRPEVQARAVRWIPGSRGCGSSDGDHHRGQGGARERSRRGDGGCPAP
jgi:transposase